MLFQGCGMRRQIAPRQQTAMHFGMQSLDPPIEHFWKPRHLSDFGYGQAMIGQQFGRSASGDQIHLQRMQLARELQNAGFVRHRNQCTHGRSLKV